MLPYINPSPFNMMVFTPEDTPHEKAVDRINELKSENWEFCILPIDLYEEVVSAERPGNRFFDSRLNELGYDHCMLPHCRFYEDRQRVFRIATMMGK